MENDVLVAILAGANFARDFGEEIAFGIVVGFDFCDIFVDFVDVERGCDAQVNFFLEVIGIDFVVSGEGDRSHGRLFDENIRQDVLSVDDVQIHLDIVIELHLVEALDILADHIQGKGGAGFLLDVIEEILVGVFAVSLENDAVHGGAVVL